MLDCFLYCSKLQQNKWTKKQLENDIFDFSVFTTVMHYFSFYEYLLLWFDSISQWTLQTFINVLLQASDIYRTSRTVQKRAAVFHTGVSLSPLDIRGPSTVNTAPMSEPLSSSPH